MRTLALLLTLTLFGCAADPDRRPVQADPVTESGIGALAGGVGFDLLGALVQLLAHGAVGF